MAEAASVCLEECRKADPIDLALDGDHDAVYGLHRVPVNDQIRRTWADEQFATEQGAYGVAILLVRETHGFSVVERSRKGTGFDYWLGNSSDTLFSSKARLEVSGIRRGNVGQITARAKQKTEQIEVSAGRLPGVVAIVEFSRPLARILDR